MFTFLIAFGANLSLNLKIGFIQGTLSFKDFICTLCKIKIYLESNFVWISASDLFKNIIVHA